ncbi:MAG: acetate--CoA ligase family protein [Halocynthiibacter sp.]
MTRLTRLFQPKSITIIGGGPWAEALIANNIASNFKGDIWPVHPKKDSISGKKAYKSLLDLPGIPDAVFVGVNRHAAIDIVRDLAKIGAGGAIIFASGFLEAQEEDNNGAALQEALLHAAGNMPILGPNCYGVLNYLDGAMLWPDQHGGKKVDRGVAIVTQSSNISINLTMQNRGLPIAYMVTAGNQAQTGLSEIAATLLDDPRVTTLGLHIEGFDSLLDMEHLAKKARNLGKEIVTLKIGRSKQAQHAAISHTASLVGGHAGAAAFLGRLGILQVDSLAVFLETLKILHIIGRLPSNRLTSLSCSGGEASLISDSAEPLSLSFPALTSRQKSDLQAALGPMVSLSNPLDYHTYIWNDLSKMQACFTAMLDQTVALSIVVLDFPRPDRCHLDAWHTVISAVENSMRDTGLPMAILASLPENMPEDIAKTLVNKGIIPLFGIEDALRAIEVAATPMPPPADPCLKPKPVKSTTTMTEAAAKSALQHYGLNIPKSIEVSSKNALPSTLAHLRAPFVLKGQGIAHKTEANAVILGLSDAADITAAMERMPCDTFLIEEMVQDKIAELLIGVVLDPAHGYVLTIAAGGILAELLADQASLLIPASDEQIIEAIQNLKINAILQGYRGGSPANMPAILAAIHAVQDFVIAHHGTLFEIEINPLICTPDTAIAADALIQIGE